MEQQEIINKIKQALVYLDEVNGMAVSKIFLRNRLDLMSWELEEILTAIDDDDA